MRVYIYLFISSLFLSTTNGYARYAGCRNIHLQLVYLKYIVIITIAERERYIKSEVAKPFSRRWYNPMDLVATNVRIQTHLIKRIYNTYSSRSCYEIAVYSLYLICSY